MRTLALDDWRALERAHATAVDERVGGHLSRRREHRKHPVEDFMFTYYRLRPGALRRWHPGLEVALVQAAAAPATSRDAGPGPGGPGPGGPGPGGPGPGSGRTDAVTAADRRGWRWYRVEGADLIVDEQQLAADRGPAARLVRDILAGTLSRPASFSCFGLHEWAMVYQLPPGAQRHEAFELRLGPSGTDSVVEAHQIQCTHFDAFRFFTPPATSRNSVQPTRALAPSLEQPGCLHATMDLYKHAYTLGPAVPGDLLLACFDLARDVRTLDMQASPYDLTALGYRPVPIETPSGKAEYARRQRGLSERARPLRERLLAIADRLALSD